MKKIKYNHKIIPMPFHDMAIYKPAKKMVSIANRFTGETVEVPNFAMAVYDVIMGAESMGQWQMHSKALSWFRKYFPKEYMIILD
tara:strand:+ start:994 stop:1248 length:255 start_codon:yes stop_codon:yes gene_type:complete